MKDTRRRAITAQRSARGPLRAAGLDALPVIARGRRVTLAEAARQVLPGNVARQQGTRRPLTFAGIGRSGRRDVAQRAEELLKKLFRGAATNRGNR